MQKKRLPHVSVMFRLKPNIGKALDDLSERTGLSKTAVVTVAIREMARREGIEVESGKAEETSDAE